MSSGNGIAGNDNSNGLNGYSIFWGGLVRVDVLKVLSSFTYIDFISLIMDGLS